MSEFNSKSLEWCESDVCALGEMCIDCTVSALKRHPDGRLLEQNPPRYSNFIWEDESRFREYMGQDVDPLLHGPYQAREIAIPMIEFQNSRSGYMPFTREQAKMLVLAHVLHDSHEGIVGDVAYPDKTEESNMAELEVNQMVVGRLMGIEPNDPFLLDLRKIMGDPHGETFMGSAFNAGEHAGYFMTGIRAWGMRKHQMLSEDEQSKCEWMGRDVTLSILPKIINESGGFPYLNHLLDTNLRALEEMA